MNCQAYQDETRPCPHKAFRVITFNSYLSCITWIVCAKHAIELRRDEARGLIEILSDEPLPNDIIEIVADKEKTQ